MVRMCINNLKMLSEGAIFMQISNYFLGETPSPILPLSVLHASMEPNSVKPSASFVTSAPALEVLDPALEATSCKLDIMYNVLYAR